MSKTARTPSLIIGCLAVFSLGANVTWAATDVQDLLADARAYEQWVTDPIGLERSVRKQAEEFTDEVTYQLERLYGTWLATAGHRGLKDCGHPVYRHASFDIIYLAASRYLIGHEADLKELSVDAAMRKTFIDISLLCE